MVMVPSSFFSFFLLFFLLPILLVFFFFFLFSLKSWMINVKKCVHLIKQHPWNQPIQLFCSRSVLTHTFDSLFRLFFLFLLPSLSFFLSHYPSPSFSLAPHSFLTPTISFIKPWDLFLLPSSSSSSCECIQWSFSLFFPFPFYFFYSYSPPLVLFLLFFLFYYSLSCSLHLNSHVSFLFCFIHDLSFHFTPGSNDGSDVLFSSSNWMAHW